MQGKLVVVPVNESYTSKVMIQRRMCKFWQCYLWLGVLSMPSKKHDEHESRRRLSITLGIDLQWLQYSMESRCQCRQQHFSLATRAINGLPHPAIFSRPPATTTTSPPPPSWRCDKTHQLYR
jgi:hypothetical protein